MACSAVHISAVVNASIVRFTGAGLVMVWKECSNEKMLNLVVYLILLYVLMKRYISKTFCVLSKNTQIPSHLL